LKEQRKDLRSKLDAVNLQIFAPRSNPWNHLHHNASRAWSSFTRCKKDPQISCTYEPNGWLESCSCIVSWRV